MKTIFLLTIISMLLARLCFAASDGGIGATSTGTSVVSVTIPRLIRISGFTDFTFNWTTGAINANRNLVVSVNYGATLASRLYTVTATGSGTGGAFTLDNGITTMAYTAWYNDVAGTGGRVALTAGVPLINQSGANKPLSTNTNRANMSFRFTAATLGAAEGGTYTGTITFVVQPQ